MVPTLLVDEPPAAIAEWLERRRALGQDGHDEVWEGVYHVSPGDESYQKFDFYSARGVEEVLIVDPQRRTVEWYTRGATGFGPTGRSDLLDLDEDTLRGEIDWPPV